MSRFIISISILIFLPFITAAKTLTSCCQVATSPYGVEKTCIKNLTWPDKAFVDYCEGKVGNPNGAQGFTVKRVKKNDNYIPAKYLGACKNPLIPFSKKRMGIDTYYIKAEGMDFKKKSCLKNKGKWLARKK